MTPIIFLIAGFVCFVAAVLFYLWADERAWTRDRNMFTEAATEIKALRKELNETKTRADFLMEDRNKMKVENDELKADVEKLHDSNANMISMSRENAIRLDAMSKHKESLPSTIQVSIVDKRAKPMSQSTKQSEGTRNETPKPTTGKREAPKEGGTKERTSTKRSPLGRSYRDLEKTNSRRSPLGLDGR